MKRFLTDISVRKVTDLSLPTNLSDAANKEYVDSQICTLTYTVSVPSDDLGELIRLSTVDFKSTIILVDADYQNGLSCSFQVFAKIQTNGVVDYNITNELGDELDDLEIDLDMQNSEFVLTIINNDLVNSVDIEARLIN